MVTITISGTPGSGKSTVAILLEKKLGIKYVYSGMIFRDLAKKHKMSLEDFGRFCEKNPSVDKELDDQQLRILQK
jgi:cytidylate kinase